MKDKITRYYKWFVLFAWLLVWFNFFMQYWLETDFTEAFLASSTILIVSYPFTTYLSNTALPRALRERRFSTFITKFIICYLLVSALLLVMTNVFRHLESIDYFKDGKLFTDFGPPWYQFINISLAIIFLNIGFCAFSFFVENLKMRQELADSEVKILSDQINPHFMFNVLNHIHTLMQKDVALASSLLLQYSDILRYQLYSGKEEFVDISRETEFLKNYLEVETMRWKGKVEVHSEWRIENGKLKIRPLMFVTFVENAFKHVHRPRTGKGKVNLVLEQREYSIRFMIENSIGPGTETPGRDSGIGLQNIRKRLDILYPGNYSLCIEQTGEFFRCTLELEASPEIKES